jgi:hypothetical protein
MILLSNADTYTTCTYFWQECTQLSVSRTAAAATTTTTTTTTTNNNNNNNNNNNSGIL